MGSIPNGSAPLQACARQISKTTLQGRTRKAQVSKSTTLSALSPNPHSPSADLILFLTIAGRLHFVEQLGVISYSLQYVRPSKGHCFHHGFENTFQEVSRQKNVRGKEVWERL